jgi:hypothetical protein
MESERMDPLEAETLAEFVKACRESSTLDANGASQTDVAERCKGTPGVLQWILSRWERGKGEPNGPQVEAIVRATGQPDEVLDHGYSLIVRRRVRVSRAERSAEAAQ